MKLLNIIPAEQLKVGDVVRVSKGDGASYLAIVRAQPNEHGVTVGFEGPNGHGMVVLYPYGEEVATMTYDTEDAKVSS